MSFSGILFYVARALVLAAPVTLILYGIRRLCMRGKRVSFSREAQVLLQDKYVLWYPIFSLSDICFVQDYVKDWTYLDTGLFGEGSAHVWLDK